MSDYGIKVCSVYDIVSINYHKIFIEKVTKKFIDISIFNYEGDIVLDNKRFKVNMKYLKNNQIPYIKIKNEIIDLDFSVDDCDKNEIIDLNNCVDNCDKPKRKYIKDGKHKSIKNLKEYKTIQQKINCSYYSCDVDDDIEDYYEKITNQHKEFLDKHKLFINKWGKIISTIP